MELRQAGKRTWYIAHDTNIGIYELGDDKVCLIDTGSSGDGERIADILSRQGWVLDYIINTHTHIDHLGGNAYLMEKYGITAYCTDYDMAFAHYTDLEVSYMNGGRPNRRLREIFRHPGKIGFHPIEGCVFNGITWRELPGHSFGMIGVKTDDDVWFLGDAYLSREYMQKRRFGYLCDVAGYLDTLEKLQGFGGKLFVPSHGIAEEDIQEIAALNSANIHSIIADLKEICITPKALDEILQEMYGRLLLRPNIANHVLLSSTMKSYLTYLEDKGEMKYQFIDKRMVWRTTV